MDADTIYALSTGTPPAGIAVIRISGPRAGAALKAMAGRLPPPRRAINAAFRDPVTSETLDRGLALWFPAPASATGEDVAEFHIHGGRAVVTAILAALGIIDGLRIARAGEFTRRAFDNGRIDLAEAEGLADLLAAETESQRRAAIMLAGGALSRRVSDWTRRLNAISASVELEIDTEEEHEGTQEEPLWSASALALAVEMREFLDGPRVERIRDGVRIVIAGPPNAGKSTLLNALAGREVAITSPVPGTTRDLIEAPVAIGGLAAVLVDTAGLRTTDDVIERVGVDRAAASVAAADVVVWLGDATDAPAVRSIIKVRAKADRFGPDHAADISVSAKTGRGLRELRDLLLQCSKRLSCRDDQVAINDRHQKAIAMCLVNLDASLAATDPLMVAEHLRIARSGLDMINGRSGIENVLDELFARFCVGK